MCVVQDELMAKAMPVKDCYDSDDDCVLVARTQTLTCEGHEGDSPTRGMIICGGVSVGA